MSDILIRGMEMPKHDDEYVIFTVYGDGGVVYGPLNRPHVRYKDRAVPIPPHGRLIDADKLNDQIESPYTEYSVMIQIRRAIKSMIKDAPTIIPAEEGET